MHRRKLVHRDIKPSNVILAGGVPKLADIGLVAPTGEAKTFIGTEGFVPPEGPGSPTAEVFAPGKVLSELSTGLDRQEFPQLPADLARLPDHRALLQLNEVVLRACDALPERRHRDGAELLTELEALQAGRPVRRFAKWKIAAAAVAVVTVAGVIGRMWRWPPAAGSGANLRQDAVVTAIATTPPVATEKLLARMAAISAKWGDVAPEELALAEELGAQAVAREPNKAEA